MTRPRPETVESLRSLARQYEDGTLTREQLADSAFDAFGRDEAMGWALEAMVRHQAQEGEPDD